MCDTHCRDFGERELTAELCTAKDVLEVGSYDVNGSIRPFVERFLPASYLGVDIMAGPRVDRVMNVENLELELGSEAFDTVITTEMLEHVPDWRKAIKNLKAVLKPGGWLLITTRAPGFPKHDYPNDHWRYLPEHFAAIFSEFKIVRNYTEDSSCGIFFLGQKPLEAGNEPDLAQIEVTPAPTV
jgi:SAM-dependent methyltransferase